MSLLIKKSSDGRLLARNDSNPELLLLARSRRMANNREFLIRHYFIPSSGIVVFAMKNLSMSMLSNQGSGSTVFGVSGRGSITSKPIWYEGKVFMIFPDIRNYSHSCLVDQEGRYLAGSNIFPEGKLCLGTSIDPLNLSPIDALCFNRANNDLGWKGGLCVGVWELNPNPENPRSRAANQIFKITTWPTWQPNHQQPMQVPPQVIAATSDW